MTETWLRTADAADLLDCTPCDLAQYSRRLDHICIREIDTKPPRPQYISYRGKTYPAPAYRGRSPLLWPEKIVIAAAKLRSSKRISVAKAFEEIVGRGRLMGPLV